MTDRRPNRDDARPVRVERSEAEWRARLDSEQYRVLREAGTEPAFTGKYHDYKSEGAYRCAGCGQVLFASDTKYDSGSGWPSFYRPIDADAVDTEVDTSFGMVRTEVKCARCEGHLGHVFDDGPEPTGKRFCINSAALEFDSREGDA